MHRYKMRRLILLFATLIFSRLCFANDFKVAVIQEEVFLNGEQTSLENLESVLKERAGVVFLYSEQGSKVNYSSVLLYATKYNHEIYLSEDREFLSTFPLDENKPGRGK